MTVVHNHPSGKVPCFIYSIFGLIMLQQKKQRFKGTELLVILHDHELQHSPLGHASQAHGWHHVWESAAGGVGSACGPASTNYRSR